MVNNSKEGQQMNANLELIKLEATLSKLKKQGVPSDIDGTIKQINSLMALIKKTRILTNQLRDTAK
jgi:hypothetical protein